MFVFAMYFSLTLDMYVSNKYLSFECTYFFYVLCQDIYDCYEGTYACT